MSSALAYHPEARDTSQPVRVSDSSSALLIATCAVLLFGPLAFGAIEPWAMFVLQASAALLVFAWGFRQWINKEIHFTPNPLYAPMLSFLGLVFIQYVTGGTAYRHATYSLLLLYICYGVLAFMVTQNLRRASNLDFLAWIVCGYGAAVSAFALLQGISSNGKLYWTVSLEHGGQLYGPYVNHNSYAGLMEMLTPFPLVLAISRFSRGRRKWAVAGVAALMASTIFLSGSRGGMISFAVEAVVLLILIGPQRALSNRPVILIAFLIFVVASLFWIGGSELTHRLVSIESETRQELSGGVRLSIDRDCLRMWMKRPFLGWGLGTFPDVYPQFRSFYTNFFVNDAHNDYLQFLVETGLAGAAIGIWFLVTAFRRARTKLDNWTETANGTLTVAALLGCIGILVHSALDFNLQIPANAALFYVLCAIGASEPLHESQRRRVRRSHLIEVSPESVQQ